MFPEDTIEATALKLPAELLAAVGSRKKQASDYRVDAFRPSLLERLKRLFGLG